MNGNDNCSLQINTFYQAPVGEENFQIKHLEPCVTEKVEREETPSNKVFYPLCQVDNFQSKATPVNPRFERKVLFNHERT